jgi:rRNA maturation protein Nop10
MQKCTECGEHCLSTKCPTCGGFAKAAAPMKWSPEDKRAHLRRQLEGVEEPGWSESLPTLPPKKSE